MGIFDQLLQTDIVSWLDNVLKTFGIQLPVDLTPPLLPEIADWPGLDFVAVVPWFVWIIILTVAIGITSRSFGMAIFGLIVFGIGIGLADPIAGVQLVYLALVCLIPALLIGFVIGYLHTVYDFLRIITWPLMAIFLALPILVIVAVAIGVLKPSQLLVQWGVLSAAPMGVFARGVAMSLGHLDRDIANQARRLGASRATQVQMLALPLAMPSIRQALSLAVTVFFLTAMAMGALGMPGLTRSAWVGLFDANLAKVILHGVQIWCLGIGLDYLFRLTGQGRLVKLGALS